MNKYINYIKNDFKSVREALCQSVGRRIPLGICILYYAIVGILVLPLIPFALVYYKIQLIRYTKMINKLLEEA